MNRCTVSGNSAVGGGGGGWGEGGGIADDYGTVYVESSTVSGNISSGAVGTVGGGIFNDSGTVDLFYSTITANAVPGGSPDDGGGICNLWGSVEFESSIVAANLASVDFFDGEFGFIVSYGFNLVGSTSGFNLVGSTSGFFVPGTADQFDVTAAALKLGPLQDNGGPTFTHALLCGSLAINAGNNANAPLTDQRGFARIVSGTIDIGAYEARNTPPSISCPAPITLHCAPPAGMSATLSVAVADFDGDPLVVVWTVDGTAAQTNAVAASATPTADSIDFTALFGLGSHEVTVSVSDSGGCLASCSTTVEVGGVVPLTVNCPAVPGAAADANCQAAVPNVLGGVTASGGCSGTNGITLSQSPVVGTLVGL
ncbi:MAG TPA: choice-of-anchor Q domain-containing protein, partial [Candidatus Dormibacteraeota bacterium]|nr:choice-of-anchor Q domain-containing protein [Candidatus Dormibacteraeota bacterium]